MNENEYASDQFQKYLRSCGVNPEFLRRAAFALNLLTQTEKQVNGCKLSLDRIAELSTLIQKELERKKNALPKRAYPTVKPTNPYTG